MVFAGFRDFFKDAARGPLPPKSGPKKKPAAKKPSMKKPAMSYGQSTVKVPPKPKPPPKGRGKVVRGAGKAVKATAPAKTNAKAPAEKGMKHKECTCKH